MSIGYPADFLTPKKKFRRVGFLSIKVGEKFSKNGIETLDI